MGTAVVKGSLKDHHNSVKHFLIVQLFCLLINLTIKILFSSVSYFSVVHLLSEEAYENFVTYNLVIMTDSFWFI